MTTTIINQHRGTMATKTEAGPAARTLRERILAADDRKRETVHVPEWDVDVEVRSLTAGERARLINASTDRKTGEIDETKLYMHLVLETTFDPASGERVFTAADRAALEERSSAALDRIAEVSLRLSGIGKKAEDAEGKD